MTTANQIRTAQINKLQRRHPNTRRQRTAHGCNRYSVQFFDRVSGALIADYKLPDLNTLTVRCDGEVLGYVYTQADADAMIAARLNAR